MTITTNTDGTTVLNADSGMALRRKTDRGPTRITRVALAAWDSADDWTDCEYAATEEENEARVIPASRTFSKLRLYAALSAIGKWDALRAWLEAQTVNGMNAWTAFSLAQDLSEDNELFGQWLAAAKAALGVDDATAESLLAASVKEGV